MNREGERGHRGNANVQRLFPSPFCMVSRHANAPGSTYKVLLFAYVLWFRRNDISEMKFLADYELRSRSGPRLICSPPSEFPAVRGNCYGMLRLRMKRVRNLSRTGVE